MAVYAVYFSPTRGTKKIVGHIAKSIKENITKPINYIDIDITTPTARKSTYELKADDILVFGAPVYAGRIPETINDAIQKIKGDNTVAVAVSVYGNRDYEDALLETADILKSNGFNVISAGAFIAEHTYTNKVGADRPDNSDLSKAYELGKDTAGKINTGKLDAVTVKGNSPYKGRNPSGGLAPDTADTCYDCMQCAIACPTEAIDLNNPRQTDASKCILCFACIKICPVHAKTCEHEAISKAKAWLEGSFTARKEPELFL